MKANIRLEELSLYSLESPVSAVRKVSSSVSLGNLVHFIQTLSDGLAVRQSRGDGGGNETV